MSERIKRIFTKIYKHYDMANHIYSLGIDISWRNAAARESVVNKPSYSVIDIATGTGDLAIAVAREAESEDKRAYVTGVDFNKEMLSYGREKIERMGIENIQLKMGDALSLKFPSGSFDVATCGFALRNVDNLETFSKELDRVLKKGGKFVLLDMATPDRAIDKVIFKVYFGIIMRPLSYLLNREAYNWLLYSLAKFDKPKMIQILKSEGFKNVRTRSLLTGVGYIITGTK